MEAANIEVHRLLSIRESISQEGRRGKKKRDWKARAAARSFSSRPKNNQTLYSAVCFVGGVVPKRFRKPISSRCPHGVKHTIYGRDLYAKFVLSPPSQTFPGHYDEPLVLFLFFLLGWECAKNKGMELCNFVLDGLIY